jgi:hypothetical protein
MVVMISSVVCATSSVDACSLSTLRKAPSASQDVGKSSRDRLASSYHAILHLFSSLSLSNSFSVLSSSPVVLRMSFSVQPAFETRGHPVRHQRRYALEKESATLNTNPSGG